MPRRLNKKSKDPYRVEGQGLRMIAEQGKRLPNDTFYNTRGWLPCMLTLIVYGLIASLNWYGNNALFELSAGALLVLSVPLMHSPAKGKQKRYINLAKGLSLALFIFAIVCWIKRRDTEFVTNISDYGIVVVAVICVLLLRALDIQMGKEGEPRIRSKCWAVSQTLILSVIIYCFLELSVILGIIKDAPAFLFWIGAVCLMLRCFAVLACSYCIYLYIKKVGARRKRSPEYIDVQDSHHRI